MTMLMDDWRGAVVQGREVELVYNIYCYRGHVFRAYPDGRIGRADDADRAFAARKYAADLR